MAHYAELDDNNTVIRISKIDDFFEMDEFGETDEYRGILHLKSLHGENTNWRKTSYNGNIRAHYACIGDTYSSELDAFIHQSPYPSWVLDEHNEWQAPVPKPESVGNLHWEWNEETKQWEEEVQ